MSEERTEYTVHPDVAIRLQVSEAHIKQLESTNDGLTMVMGRHRETMREQAERIAELEAALADRDARIAEVGSGFNAARRVVEMQLQTIARLEADNRRLRHLDAMPVDAMERYHAYTHYDVHAANDAGYTTQQFDSDEEDIRLWLTSLDGDA